MKQTCGIIVFILAAFSFFSCRQPQKTVEAQERFAREKVLYVALEGNFNDYFLFNGHPMGFGLEMLENFSDYLGCKLVILPSQTLAEQWKMLEKGQADIIASNINITEDRLKHARFTHPIYHTAQVLVQLDSIHLDNPACFVGSMKQLEGQTVWVRKHSVFEESIIRYNKEQSVQPIRMKRSSKTEEELMYAVAHGDIAFTVASYSKAARFGLDHPQIDYGLCVDSSKAVAWALHPDADSLLSLANHWLDSMQQNKSIGYLYHKYYEIPYRKSIRSTKSGFRKLDSVNVSRKQKQWEKLLNEDLLSRHDSLYFFSTAQKRSINERHFHGKTEISPFDKLLQKHSRQIGWDWRLLASLIYQESQFQDHLVSSKGAIGLMQIMPSIARKYGITVRSGDEEQIAAGVKYIKSIYRSLPEEIPAQEQVYFVLGAYNIGLGHILDARRLATKYGANPNVWYDNVEKYLQLKSDPDYYRDTASRNGYANGRQAVDFVRKIDARYMHYRNLTK